MSDEVFTEAIETSRRRDYVGYIKNGVEGPVHCETRRVLYRLRLNQRNFGVQAETLATFHARAVRCPVGDKFNGVDDVAVIGGVDRFGETFLLTVPWKWMENPSRYARRLQRAFINGIGAGSCILPGCLTATVRAIMQLSRDGEPMPEADEVL